MQLHNSTKLQPAHRTTSKRVIHKVTRGHDIHSSMHTHCCIQKFHSKQTKPKLSHLSFDKLEGDQIRGLTLRLVSQVRTVSSETWCDDDPAAADPAACTRGFRSELCHVLQHFFCFVRSFKSAQFEGSAPPPTPPPLPTYDCPCMDCTHNRFVWTSKALEAICGFCIM